MQLLSFTFLATILAKKRDKRFEGLTDKELDRLMDEWEEEDIKEGLVDEMDKPEHLRRKHNIDLSALNLGGQGNVQEELLKSQKKHVSLMMFVTLIDKSNPPKDAKAKKASKEFTTEVSGRWESQLANAHEFITRYVVDDDQVLIQLKDGSRAFAIRDFLVLQEECFKVNIEQQDYKGKGYVIKFDKSLEQKKKSKKKKSKTEL